MKMTPSEIIADYRFDEMLKIEESGVDISQMFPAYFVGLFFMYKRILRKTHLRAQKKIYYWWIPICYDMGRECGQRMMARNWDRAQAAMFGEDEGIEV